jgi:hypothetical protein
MNGRVAEVGRKSIACHIAHRKLSAGKDEPLKPIDDVLKSIDTTLTPEQKIYADSIRKQIRGGMNSPRCKSSKP